MKKFLILEQLINVDYPFRFINSVNREFQKGKNQGHDNFIISQDLLELLNHSYPLNRHEDGHPKKEEKFQVV